MMLNFCNNCSRGMLVNTIKSNFLREKTLIRTSHNFVHHLVKDSSPIVIPLQSISKRCFSLNYSRILYRPWMFGKSRPVKDDEGYKKDQKGRSIVYTGGTAHNLLYVVKSFSILTSATGIYMMYTVPTTFEDSSMYVISSIMSIVAFFTFVTPVLIHYVAKKYVGEIVYESEMERYTAITYNFFAMPKEIQFKAEDVKPLDVPINFTTALVEKDGKKVPLFIARNLFVDRVHYDRLMMGFKMTESININEEIEKLAKKKSLKETTTPSKL